MEKKIVTVVLNAAQALKYLADEGMGQLKAISDKLHLPKTTTHRLLRTLEAAGLVSSNGKGMYFLGPLAFRLAASPMVAHRFLSVCASDEMTLLRDFSGETVVLHVLFVNQRICLHEVPSQQHIRYTAGVGATAPLYVGSASKMLLAELEEQDAKGLIESLDMKAVGPSTIVDKSILWREVQKARKKKYATSFGERVLGSASASVPIRGYITPACLSILGPKERFVNIREVVKEMQASAARIACKIKDFAYEYQINRMG